jgi:hypothetical protein
LCPHAFSSNFSGSIAALNTVENIRINLSKC